MQFKKNTIAHDNRLYSDFSRQQIFYSFQLNRVTLTITTAWVLAAGNGYLRTADGLSDLRRCRIRKIPENRIL